MKRGEKPKSFAELYPDIAKEWDFEKNEQTPEDVLPSSTKIVHWICPKGHKYEAMVSRRAKRGDGCNICSGRRVVEGINDLGTQRPELMIEWDFDKNYFIYPTEVTVMSNKKVWWKCRECGYSWQAAISNRTRGTGCPKCRYRRAVNTRKQNNLSRAPASLYEARPELLKEWDYEKNKDIADPMKVSRGSSIKVWWKCQKCGHEWQATIYNRSRGSGCRQCSFKIPRYKRKEEN